MRAAITLALLLSLVPDSASACSPSESMVLGVHPAGGTLPANQWVVIEGMSMGGSIEATLDGEPVELSSDELRRIPNFCGHGSERLALRPQRTPAVGQTLRIRANLCEIDIHGGGGCAFAVTYLITEPVTEELPAVESLTFGTSWTEDDEGRVLLSSVRPSATLPELDDEGWYAVHYTIEAFDRESGYTTFEWDSSQGYPEWSYTFVGGGSDICVSARIVGAIGEGPSTTTCDPCEIRRHTPDGYSCRSQLDYCPVEERAGTDRFPCEPYEYDPHEGGGCAVAPASAPALAPFWMLALAAALWLRRARVA